MPNNLKYAAKIAQYTGCPPVECIAVTRTLFRYVHRDPEHKNNWLPPAEIDPKREKTQCCEGYALSFITTKEAARRRYLRLRAKYPRLPAVMGDCLATVDVRPEHGLLSPNGEHRDLHEYEGATFQPKAVEPI
jgi:hypothetical protein